jgi:uncharacterized protein YbaP (TraB family)
VAWETLPEEVRQAFESSEVIVLEADIESVPDTEIMARMMLPEGESLEEKIGTARFEKLVDSTGQPEMIMDRFRPWIAQSTLVRRWVGGDKPMDVHLQSFGKARDKELAYLESPIEQIEVLDDAVTVDMLVAFLDEPEPQREALDKAMKAYLEGDAAGLKAAIFRPEDLEAHPQFYELAFAERNRAWLPRLQKRFAAKPSFVAVGAGHLVGPENLVELLREQGWTVTR